MQWQILDLALSSFQKGAVIHVTFFFCLYVRFYLQALCNWSSNIHLYKKPGNKFLPELFQESVTQQKKKMHPRPCFILSDEMKSVAPDFLLPYLRALPREHPVPLLLFSNFSSTFFLFYFLSFFFVLVSLFNYVYL